MNPTTAQLVPPIIVWLWKRQHEISGPVPGSELAKELRCQIRELPRAQAVLRKQGWVFESMIVMDRWNKPTTERVWYTGRTTIAACRPVGTDLASG